MGGARKGGGTSEAAEDRPEGLLPWLPGVVCGPLSGLSRQPWGQEAEPPTGPEPHPPRPRREREFYAIGEPHRGSRAQRRPLPPARPTGGRDAGKEVAPGLGHLRVGRCGGDWKWPIWVPRRSVFLGAGVG